MEECNNRERKKITEDEERRRSSTLELEFLSSIFYV